MRAVRGVLAALVAVGAVAVVLSTLPAAEAVDRANFKTCKDSSFCQRNRALKPGTSPFSVRKDSISTSDSNTVTFEIDNVQTHATFTGALQFIADNTARFTMDEKKPIYPRYQVEDVLKELSVVPYTASFSDDDGNLFVAKGTNGVTVIMTLAPFQLDFVRNGEVYASFNQRGLLSFEHYRTKEEDMSLAGEDEEGRWAEKFKNHDDTKPRGPSSVGFDVSFPGVSHVYGIPEHAADFSLPSTEGKDPFRLYNLDVFEYELDETMALYGSVPYMIAHNEKRTAGFFFLNAAEMWIDIDKVTTSTPTKIFKALKSLFASTQPETESQMRTDTHWFAESGIIDVFVFHGPKPVDVFRQYSQLTGFMELPPLFSTAYHQCRWNYNDEEDVAFVSQSLDDNDMPADVIWLDIEHTDGKRYMTWDKTKFPTPKDMQDKLAAVGRKMVNIVDPHIKRANGYRIHEDATSLGYYVKDRKDSDYDGWCWPGSSSWLDFINPKIRSWWADQFALDKYDGSTLNLYFWNDMNEPSVFNGPEVTMHKDAKHFGGWEHRDVHNVYGMWQPAFTAEGIRRRAQKETGKPVRPFVLSRAFFAGSQQYGAIWTGDNAAEWGHLGASISMCLSVSVAGIPFCGADIGGFFGNPDTELVVRWYQLGAFQPFMRAHGHLDTKRREPYLFDSPHREYIRRAIHSRYEHLPYIYTTFKEAATTGTPIMRPLWAEFPEDKATFDDQTQFMVGSALLVAPALEKDQKSRSVYFPGNEVWYETAAHRSWQGPSKVFVSTPLKEMSVYQRGGTIIAKKLRVRRTSALMHNDPFTLVATLGADGGAEGALYVDDYNSYDYDVESKFLQLKMNLATTAAGGLRFQLSPSEGSGAYETREWVERLSIFGVEKEPSAVYRVAGTPAMFDPTADGMMNEKLSFSYRAGFKSLDIKKPSTVGVHAAFSLFIVF